MDSKAALTYIKYLQQITGIPVPVEKYIIGSRTDYAARDTYDDEVHELVGCQIVPGGTHADDNRRCDDPAHYENGIPSDVYIEYRKGNRVWLRHIGSFL